MVNFEHSLHHRLKSAEEENRLRALSPQNQGIDFSSNDYLGLARSEKLFQSIQKKMESEKHIRNGATGSRLLTGNSELTERVESQLAKIFHSETALIFNSGYAANQAVLSAIPLRNDTILYDELAHACIKDGARLSMAQRFSFKHNDLDDLESKINRSNGRKFIAVESIYSMDGDQCPLSDLVALAEKHNATIILDEAHSTGVLGPQGSGLAVSLGLENKIPVRIYTFGKAMGVHGACIAGSKALIDCLINFARPFIYTTALPTHSIISIESAFDYLRDHIYLQEELKNTISTFMESTVQQGSKSAIQTLIIPGNSEVKKKARQLQEHGFDIRPILSPTVKEGTERLRICLHSFNTIEQIVELNALLKDISSSGAR